MEETQNPSFDLFCSTKSATINCHLFTVMTFLNDMVPYHFHIFQKINIYFMSYKRHIW